MTPQRKNPILPEGDYFIRKFDPTDDEIAQEVSAKGLMFCKAECESWLDEVDPTRGLGYSYAISRILVNSKYNKWKVSK
jgi:hypothetical protein